MVAGLSEDPAAIEAARFLVALPTASRREDPDYALVEMGIARLPGEDLLATLNRSIPIDHPAKTALADTLREVVQRWSGEHLFDVDDWAIWRGADDGGFCDLAMLFFAHLNRQLFACVLPDSPELERFARECAVITRSFSARWFNACARNQTAESGSIKWYLGHCLGKIDLELSRELSDWQEPVGNPWRRRRPVAASLDL